PEAVDEPEVAEEPGDAVPAEPAQTDEVPIEGNRRPAGRGGLRRRPIGYCRELWSIGDSNS
ncbi:hypothetical protein ABZW03_29880, partial [Kitasatospora sp. NPDC004799]|uniref:hypothetical protein n=1 Tax=Kitasatospora sp. NPDC004799 TaxID=3154460 RepID=UPI0033B8E8B6